MNEEIEWFCTRCKRVFWYGNGKCCGPVEKFQLEKHGRELIGLSNSWIDIWERWKNHPLLKKAVKDVYDTGNAGAAMVLNRFIEILLENYNE